MLVTDMPNMASIAKHSRNEVGIAKPTSSADRRPNAPSTTIITSAMAVSTEPSSWLTMPCTWRLSSIEKSTCTAVCNGAGQEARTFSTTSLTAATVSMIGSPLRLTTCSAMVVSPLNRAVPAASWNVRLICATSPMVTTRSPFTLTGRS